MPALTEAQQKQFVALVNRLGLSGERYDFARTVFEAAIASPDAPALTAIAAKSNINCK